MVCCTCLFSHYYYSQPYDADPHGHHVGSHAAHGPEGDNQTPDTEWTDGKTTYEKQSVDDIEALQRQKDMDESAAAQIIGVFILEFGVILHRYESW
jgi:zinc transporter 1/2/3